LTLQHFTAASVQLEVRAVVRTPAEGRQPGFPSVIAHVDNLASQCRDDEFELGMGAIPNRARSHAIEIGTVW
jgi:hypothetical protein